MNPLTGFTKVARIVRQTSPDHDTIAGFPHYFPLSFLPADFWTAMEANPVLRVTNAGGKQLPVHVIDMDVVYQKGALWFPAAKTPGKRVFYIHYESEDAEPQLTGLYGTEAVWTAFTDVVHANEYPSDLELSYMANAVNGDQGLIQGSPSNFWTIDSQLEQNAHHFTNAFGSNTVEWGAGTFDKWATPRTFFFLIKFLDVTGKSSIFKNWTEDSVGNQAFSLDVGFAADPNESFIGFELGQNGVAIYNTTNEGELADLVADTWYLVAIKYDQGANGVEIDIQKTTRGLYPGEETGAFPADANSPVRILWGGESAGDDFALSSIMWFDGALAKAQRDVFFDNWMTPGDFWLVQDLETGPDKKNICFSSHQNSEICFTSKLKK